MVNPNAPRRETEDVKEEYQTKGDYLLEVLELAMNRDPDQDFELLLVLEREKEEAHSE